MGGHVNMMDDVLISNLPPEILRSSLRALISQGQQNRSLFIQSAKKDLFELQSKFPKASVLFPEPNYVSPESLDYLCIIRCIFSSKPRNPTIALEHLTHFVTAINKTVWSPSSQLSELLEVFGGDIVHAMQALKETVAYLSADARDKLGLPEALEQLMESIAECRLHCDAMGLKFLFDRPERQIKDVVAILWPEATTSQPRILQSSRFKVSVPDPSTSKVEYIQLGPLRLPRVFNGLWQLSSAAWGSGSADNQERALIRLIEAGLVAADMADHYGDAELIYGDFRNRLPDRLQPHVYAATKWCVFESLDIDVTPEWILCAVQERYRRLGGVVDLLQLHWQNYDNKRYLDVLVELVHLTRSRPDLITAVGLCNFDSQHVEEVCKYILHIEGSVGIVSNQVQFSLIDQRPLKKMSSICAKYGLRLLTYGSVCGGFLSDKWLDKQPPSPYSTALSLTPSQRKYLDMITVWSGGDIVEDDHSALDCLGRETPWVVFQNLLRTLKTIAIKHSTSIANVATRWVLQQPSVGAVILGTRLGISDNTEDNLCAFGWELSLAELQEISIVGAVYDKNGISAVELLFGKLGDCGNEYR